MRVLIFEPHSEGHRLQFVRMCVEAVTGLASQIVLATGRSAPQSDEFRTHLSGLVGGAVSRLSVDASLDDAESEHPMRTALRRSKALAASIRRLQPDHVLVPYADGLAQMSGARRLLGRDPRRGGAGGVEMEGILMRGRFAYPRASNAGWREGLIASAWERAWLAATTLAPFNIFHHLDPIPFEALHARGASLAARSRLIPEPVEPLNVVDRLEARHRLNLPLDGRCICCPGWLDQRKGADRLIRAFATASLRENDRLLLAGRVDAPVRHVLEECRDLRQRGRIIVHDRCVSDEHLHLAMSAADVVCAPYPRHIGSSGIVVRAAGLRRRVLTSDFGWLAMVTRRFGLGMTCDCADTQALARALPIALDAEMIFHPAEAASRFTQFHTKANFAAHISQRVRERVDVQPARGADSDLCTWDWVMQAAADVR